MSPRVTRAEAQAKTRGRLLRSAYKIFARKGFDRASIDEIAENAGFTKGAVYANFGSKEELFLALLDAGLDQQEQSLTAIFAGKDGEGGGLVERTRRRYSNLLEQNRTWRLLFTEFWLHAARDPELQRKLAERYKVMRGDIARLLEQYFAEQGLLLSVPAEQIAAMLVALTQGLGMQKIADPPALADDLFLTAFDLILKGLTATGVAANELGTKGHEDGSEGEV
jgi:AcrR family transcriptional regulator